MTNGNLIVTPAKDGSGFYWEGGWRCNGRSIKRRIGKAHVIRRSRPISGSGLASWQRTFTQPRTEAPEGFLTAVAAQERLSQMIEQHEASQSSNMNDAVTTFGSLADAWLAERAHDVDDAVLKPSSLRDYSSMLSRASDPVKARGSARTAWLMTEWEHTEVATIDMDAVERFEAKLRAAGLSARTRQKYLVLLSMIFDYSVRKRVATINVLSARGRSRNGRKQTKDVAVYSLATVEQIAAAASDEQIGNIIRLAALTGLRQGELLSLRWKDVGWKESSLHVRSTISLDDEGLPKSGKSRSVPLAEQATIVLEAIQQRDKYTEANDLVFGHERGDERRGKAKTWEHIDASHVRKGYKQARDLVIGDELPALRFHDLRHTFGSLLASAGVPLVDIKAYMGHSSITTTEIYLRFVPKHDAAERLTAVFANGNGDKPAVIKLSGKR